MDAARTTPAARRPPASPRWDRMVDWLALAMLLAGSIVWPH